MNQQKKGINEDNANDFRDQQNFAEKMLLNNFKH